MRKKFLLMFYSLMAIIFLVACGEGENNDQVENVVEYDENVNEEEFVEDSEVENEELSAENNKEEDEEPIASKVDKGHLTAHFIDVGQAEATLFEYTSDQEQYRILVDTGNWNRSEVVEYLRGHGVTSLDIIIGTHIDADHIGQMDRIIEMVDVGEVWMTGDVGTSQTYMKVLDAIEAHDVGYHEPRAGEVYDVGPLALEILHPSSLSSNTNSNSISMKLTYDDVSLVLTGDADVGNEASMIARGYNLKGTVLQLGHHGSNTSTSEKFLQAVDPEVAIYSASSGNSYGHPHEEVVSLIKEQKIDLYGTDVHGTIVLKTDGKKYTIDTERSGTVTSPKKKTNTPIENQKNESKQVEKHNEANEIDTPVSPTNCININTASFAELQEIIHIGPERAEELIQIRPFNSVDDLTRIKGIGPARIRDIIDQNIACIGG